MFYTYKITNNITGEYTLDHMKEMIFFMMIIMDLVDL